VTVHASDSRPALWGPAQVQARAELALDEGFVRVVFADEDDQHELHLYVRDGTRVRWDWQKPSRIDVQGGEALDLAAAREAWAQDLESLSSSIAGWDQRGDPPGALLAVVDERARALADLGDTPYGHLLRLRHASYVAQLLGPQRAWSVIDAVPPDSISWAAYAPLLVELRWFLRDVPEATRRLDAACEGGRDAGLRSACRAAQLLEAKKSGNDETLAAAVLDATVLEGRVVVGEPMPRFVLRSVDDNAEIRSADLRRPYLLEVWSTWCAPCIAQMDALHALHEAAGGLTIISVAINDTTAPVEEFRAQRWPMPWLQAWVPGGEPLADAWGMDGGVPFGILVDAQGRVVQAQAHVSLDRARDLGRQP
jgi:thiol-disulfide isomerase/thioredoxin